MSNPRNASTSLLHRLGVAGLAYSGAFQGTGAPSRRRPIATLVVLLTTLGAFALAASPALATGEHAFTNSFGSEGSGPGQFKQPEGVAVNEATGDVYVADRGNDRVEYFSSTGEYKGQFNGSGLFPNEVNKEGMVTKAPEPLSEPRDVAVDNSCFFHEQETGEPLSSEACEERDPSNGDVYVTDNGGQDNVIDKFSPTGAYLGQITGAGELESVAVDPEGTVGVKRECRRIVSYSDAAVNEFLSSREPQLNGCGETGLAMDLEPISGTDDFYLVTGPQRVLSKIDSAGEVLGSLPYEDKEEVTGLAVDPATHDVYVAQSSSVTALGVSGSLIESLGSGLLDGASGVAVSSSSENVYVADASAGVVDLFAPVHGAGIHGESATSIEATAATLQAQINPNETSTTCVFEYGLTSAYGTTVPCEPSVLGSGTSRVPVSVRLNGLASGTTYYYRVVAVSELAPGEHATFAGPGQALATPNPRSGVAAGSCRNEQLRAEQPYGLDLPDCRAYELVSPLDKNDQDASFANSRASTSDESPAIAYLSTGSFAEFPSEPKSALLADRYVARRGPGGWSTQNISPPYEPFEGELNAAFNELLFTPDLSKGLVESAFTPLVPGELAGYVNLYVADTSSDAYQLVTTLHPPEMKRYKTHSKLSAAGVSTDLSHVVFEEDDNLTESNEVLLGQPRVYEWVNGTPRLVDQPPAGVKFEGVDGVGSRGDGSSGATEVGDTWHAVSADGSRVFFTAGEGKAEGAFAPEAEGQLYVRENAEQPQSPYAAGKCADSADACTVEVSASEREPADPNDHTNVPGNNDAPRPARYWDASADGSKVFFTSRAELTNQANTGPADNAENLYEYDLEDGVLTDLTSDGNRQDTYGASVLGVVTASEDGSYVYFVAEGTLTTEDNAEQKKPESGKPNLYLYHGGKVTFIAMLAPATSHGQAHSGSEEQGGDSSDWHGEQQERESSGGTNQFGPGQHTARVTADGTRLAFESERSLTGYDNEPAQEGECGRSGGGCREVYLFNAEGNGGAGTLICASCDPSGAQPVGPAELGGHSSESESEPSPFYLPRNLSEDGGHVFFQTPNALVPQDSNGKLDVYEWEAGAEGTCRQAGGCVLPISDVAGDNESQFMDATPSGEDVFIATKNQLVPAADTDSRVNVYDARVGGGFPVSVAAPSCTNADSCKPPVSPQPTIFGAPASATFSGPGNPALVGPSPSAVVKPAKKTVKCSKDRTHNKHGKCVAKKKSKKKAKKARRASDDRRVRS